MSAVMLERVTINARKRLIQFKNNEIRLNHSKTKLPRHNSYTEVGFIVRLINVRN